MKPSALASLATMNNTKVAR